MCGPAVEIAPHEHARFAVAPSQRLTVAERLASTPVVDGEIPVSTPESDTKNIVDQVTEYFDSASEPTQVAEAPTVAP